MFFRKTKVLLFLENWRDKTRTNIKILPNTAAATVNARCEITNLMASKAWGKLRELAGRICMRMLKNTIWASKMVTPNEIFSPLSTGIRKITAENPVAPTGLFWERISSWKIICSAQLTPTRFTSYSIRTSASLLVRLICLASGKHLSNCLQTSLSIISRCNTIMNTSYKLKVMTYFCSDLIVGHEPGLLIIQNS